MPDSDIQRLVERLRGPCVDYDKTDMLDGAEPLFMDCGTLREAANEIERLYMLAKANNDLARRHADTITDLRAEVARLRGLLDSVGAFLDDFARADLDEGAADAVTVGMVYQQQAQTVVLPRITLVLKDSRDEGDRP